MKVNKKKLVIGVTGPIASGKNEVCKVFKKNGFCVIEADKIGHYLLRKGTETYKNIVEKFGERILSDNGNIDRKILSKIVFSKKTELRKLNKITHPKILKIIHDMLMDTRKDKIVINAAVLNEIGLLPFVNLVILVLAGKEKRMMRLIKSRNYTRILAKNIIGLQDNVKNYRKIADIIIINNGSLMDLKKKTEYVIKKLNFGCN